MTNTLLEIDFFMVLHLIISDSSNHPMIIWRNGQMCQLAIVWRSREYMYLWVTLDIVSILGLATVCGLVGCWGDNVTRWSRATGAPQTTDLAACQSYLGLHRERMQKQY